MKREKYEIKLLGNKNKIIAAAMGFSEYDAMANAGLVGKYAVKSCIKWLGEPYIVLVEKK